MATPPGRRGRGPGFAVAFAALVIVSIALISLVWQNQEAVPLEWLWISTEVPLFVIVLVTALIAVLIDELVGLVWRTRRQRRLSEKEELKRLRSEVAASDPPAVEDPDGI